MAISQSMQARPGDPLAGSRSPALWRGLCLASAALGLSILITAGVTLFEAHGNARGPAASVASWLFFAGVTVLISTQAMLRGERAALLCMRGAFLVLAAVSPLVWHSLGMRVFAESSSGLWLLLSFAAAPRRLRPTAPQASADEGLERAA